MAAVARLVILALCACAYAQYAEDRAPRYIPSEPKVVSTPVPILKQINRHNEDGSYTYGYEAADGSFKIETKSDTGEVKGKYGYKDDTGKLRVIEYGANKYGFQPAGEGITVAPPTLVDESTRDEGLRPGKSQGGNYRAQSVDYDYDEPAPTPRPAPRPAPAFRPQPQQQQQQQYRPQQQQQQQQYRQQQQQQQQQYRPAPQPQPQPQYRPAPQAAPAPPKPQFFAGAAPAPVERESFFSPEPQSRPKQEFRPAPQPQQFSQRPQGLPSPQLDQAPPRFPPANQIQQQRSQPYSMLDQLLKEYALPQGGSAPLHDITFGSY